MEVFNRNVMNWQPAPSLNIDRSAAAACVMNNSANITACALNGEFFKISYFSYLSQKIAVVFDYLETHYLKMTEPGAMKLS